MKKFKRINEWEVLTPNGWSNFDGITKLQKECYIKITFEDESWLKCSENHKIKLISNKFIHAKNLKVGMILLGKKSIHKIIKRKRKINKVIDLYDLNNVEKNKEFYSNDIVSHNCALIDDADDLWTSAMPTLSTGGKSIILSTPRGKGNFFHRMWQLAEENNDGKVGKNGFHPIILSWQLHPERNEEWRRIEGEKIGNPKQAAQEYDCNFLSSGDSVVDLNIIEWYRKNRQKDPTDVRGIDHGLWVWQYPDYTRSYIVCFPTGESILTNSGIKKVENITYHDKLINKDGHLTDIIDIKVRPYDGKIYEITPSNTFRKTKFTDEHPILVSQSSKLIRMYKKNNLDYKFNQRYWEHNFKFTDAKNVKVGDWICYPNIYKKKLSIEINQIWSEFENMGRVDFQIKNNPLLDNNFWWFIGIWLAEGWCYTDKNENVTIYTSHNSNEIDIINRIKKIIGDLGIKLLITSKENNTTICQFNSKQIGMFLKKYFGKYAFGKFISEKIKYLSDSKKISLIKGYIDGDGCVIDTKTNGKNIKITSISLKLLEDCQDILFSVGCISTVNKLRNKKQSIIKYKTINQKEAYSLNIHDFGCSKILDGYIPKSKTQRIADCYFDNNEDYIYFKIKAIKEMNYEGLVHNFTTSTGTFLCRNITTHNCADVARGDGLDFSACHVLDAITLDQCAEYKGSLGTKDFGNFLVGLATEYNNALLIIENAGVGWSTIQSAIDRNYANLFYSSVDLKYVDVQRQLKNRYDSEERKLVPGFSTTLKTRPLIVSNLEQYCREEFEHGQGVRIYSKRTLAELDTFIWKAGKAQAMEPYTDDLCVGGDILIKTKRGNIFIRDIIIGDEVLTHKGQYKKVINKFVSYNREYCYIKCNGKLDLIITSNHPVFYYSGQKSSWIEYMKSNSWIKFSSEKIDPVNKLNVINNCYLFTPQINNNSNEKYIDLKNYADETWEEENGKLIHYIKNFMGKFSNPKQNKVERYLPINNEFYFILGYFLAEGSRGEHGIQFASHIKEIKQREFVKLYFEKYGFKCYIYTISNNRCNLVINSILLKKLFVPFGKSSTKRIPFEFETNDLEKNYWLLIGYMVGDGCIYKTNIKSFTISYDIAMYIQHCCTNIGIPCHISFQKNNKHYIKNKRYNIKDGYVIRIPSQGLDFIYSDLKLFKEGYISHKTTNQSFIKILKTENGNINLGKITNIENIKSEIELPFYNLEIEDNNSYIANGIAIHNCMSLGIGLWVRDTALLLRQKGIDLTKSTLEHMDITKSDIKPFYKTRIAELGHKSWQMPTGRHGFGQHNDEDLRWLLG